MFFFGKKPKFFYKKGLLSKLLLPLSWLYTTCFFLSNFNFKKGKKVCKKTICVGNLVVGGSGKTPICIELGKILSEKYNLCFITKGYGRKTERDFIVPYQHRELFNPRKVGDETLLLSEVADVFIVSERSKTKCGNYDLAICDDGYFDNSIHKDVTIAVFDGNFFIGNGYILPSGSLRYKFSSLEKADFAIITDYNDNTVDDQIDTLIEYIDRANVLKAKIIVKSKHNAEGRYLAFSGIGENSKFINTLKNNHINVIGSISFDDHTVYSKNKIKSIKKYASKIGASNIITTNKDFVKLPKEICSEMKIEVLDIGYEIEDIDKILKFIDKV